MDLSIYMSEYDAKILDSFIKSAIADNKFPLKLLFSGNGNNGKTTVANWAMDFIVQNRLSSNVDISVDEMAQGDEFMFHDGNQIFVGNGIGIINEPNGEHKMHTIEFLRNFD